MTIPIVTELPLALEPITTDRFAAVVSVPRGTGSRPAADPPPSRRRIVD